MNLPIPDALKFVFTISFAGLITACASLDSTYPEQPAAAVGSKIQLNISAKVPMDQDRVHVQDGQLLGKQALDIERIYCSVVMRRYQDADQPELKLEPGEFTVSRVRLQNDYVFNPVNYVNSDQNFYQPSYGVNYRIEIHLETAGNSDIRALMCTNHQLKYSPIGPYPTRSHIEKAMGYLADLTD